jgi:hypothetical protein
MATSQEVQDRIKHFIRLKNSRAFSMLRSIEVQFCHMAQGGDGSAAMEGEIKQNYYPTWKAQDFQTVCDVMGWEHERSSS